VLLSRQVAHEFISKFHPDLIRGTELTWKPFSIIGESRNSPFFKLLGDEVRQIHVGPEFLLAETPSSQEEEKIFDSLHVRKISREIESRRHIQFQENFKKLGRESEAVFCVVQDSKVQVVG
jgi:hypothetical protein